MSYLTGPSRIALCTEDDDIVTISCKQTLFAEAFNNLNKIRQSGQLCDVSLVVDGRKISAHKVVLSASIPYFLAMFTSDMMEAHQKEVQIHEIEWDTLEQLISFAYTGEIRISAGNVQNIMVGANFLQIESLVEDCAEFLRKRLHPNNALSIRNFCASLGCKMTLPVIDMYIEKYFLAICQSNDFLQLQLEDLVQLLRQDALFVESEENIYEAILRWINHDPLRRVHMSEVLSCCRLHLLKPSFLSDKVATHQLVRSNLACRDLVDEAKDFHLIPERRVHGKAKARCCSKVPGLMFAVGGSSAGASLSAVEMFDPLLRKWRSVHSMNGIRCRVGVAVNDRLIYVVGGYNGQDRLRTVEQYDYNKNAWTDCPPLEYKRSALGCVFLHGCLYVCGGYDGITSLSTVEIYYPDKKLWAQGISMNKQRSAAGCVALDGFIYVIGGHDGISIFNTVERYSPETRTWENIKPMISRRCRLGAAVLNGKIYACGGYDGATFLNSVECYDPHTNEWTPVTPMNMKRSRVSVVTNANTLYAIAGYDGISNLSSMETYSEETDQWELAPSLSVHEGGVGVGVLPMPINMLENH